MPAGKRQQSNAMLYTVIVFVALFIIATVAAVICYINTEEYRTSAEEMKSQRDELVTSKQWSARGRIVGTKKGRETYLGKMIASLDEMVYLILGGVAEDTSAEVKVDTVNAKIKDMLEVLGENYIDIESLDPNTIGLVQIIQELSLKLDNMEEADLALTEQFKELQERFSDAMKVSFEKEQNLLAEKEQYYQQVNDIETKYNELRALLDKTAEQRVSVLMTQLDEEKANYKSIRDELLKTEAKLRMVAGMMKRAQQQLTQIKPFPDNEVAAFKPDGRIILLDGHTGIVHLNIGSDNRVYPGLTFAVYDKTIPIPRDGIGKAEVKVFSVEKNISTARITESNKRNPILVDDIVANLIWDSKKTNVFVIAGEFDLDGDRNVDIGSVAKVKTLIEKWGGQVEKNVSVDTDFVILGRAPWLRTKPTFDELEVYPLAMEKYEDSLKRLAHYKQVQEMAKDLLIPVLNYERFLYFIGYKSQAAAAGAF